MQKRANVLLVACAVVALQPLFPIASLGAGGGKPARQAGEDRWVPSLAIMGGTTIQQQAGTVFSFEGTSMDPQPLQGFHDGDDLAVSPFVGGSLELMTPALPIPTRPRLFFGAEILPTFASDRELAVDGDPGCVKGPEPGAPCTSTIVSEGAFGPRSYEEDAANGEGSQTTSRVDTLTFGASLGVAFPARIAKRQLRIKPSAGWISYKVDAEGIVVDAACNPMDRCVTSIDHFPGFPPFVPPFDVVNPGFLRETTLEGSASQRFHAIGGGLDIEMDTIRYGPLGVSLFLGGRAYRVLGDRTIRFSTTQIVDDEIGMDIENAEWGVDVDPWMYRAHVGIRFQWLGSVN